MFMEPNSHMILHHFRLLPVNPLRLYSVFRVIVCHTKFDQEEQAYMDQISSSGFLESSLSDFDSESALLVVIS